MTERQKKEKVWSVIHKICCDLDELDEFLDENEVDLFFMDMWTYNDLKYAAFTLRNSLKEELKNERS